MATEDKFRPSMKAVDLLLALLLLALGMLSLAAAQARLRQIGEDALARTLASIWLAARVEEWAASPYGSPIAPAHERVPELLAEAGLSAARPVFALRHRACLTLSCESVGSFRAVEPAQALARPELPQWEEAEFGLELTLPSGRSERLAVRVRRSPLTVGAATRVASAAVLRSE